MALDGALTDVRGFELEAVSYWGPAEHLQHVWVAARASIRHVAEHVTLDQVISGDLPRHVAMLTG